MAVVLLGEQPQHQGLEVIAGLVSRLSPAELREYALTLDDPEDVALLERAVAAKLAPPSAPGALRLYHDRPAAFARDLVAWPEGKSLTAYQGEVLDGLVEYGRVAVRGPHTLGKTAMASLAIWWFALTRDEAGEDWKAATTAYRWGHLIHYLWPELKKWYKLLRWDVMEREPVKEGKELLTRALKLDTGEAFAASPDDAASIEGAHADQLLYVFDEAKTIPPDVWDAVEGAFAGAGPDTQAQAFALAISTPGEPTGRFYEIHKRKPGTEDWHVRHVKKEEPVAAGRMSVAWIDQRRLQWGERSALFQNRVEGEFASSDEDSTIPLAWVEAAQDRWRERYGRDGLGFDPPGELEALGVDCSGTGTDRTVLARRYGDVVGPLERPAKTVDPDAQAIGDNVGLEEMATAGRIVAALRKHPKAKAVVDAGGLGSTIVGSAREDVANGKRRVEAFIAGAGTDFTDALGEWRFADTRSAAWWHMRECLHPDSGLEVCLPPDDTLTGDLTSPHYKEMARGKIKVESKDTIRERLGRSTDDGDAVVQAFWPGERRKRARLIA